MALGPEGAQVLGGEGGDQLAQSGHGPAAGRLHLVLAPAAWPRRGGGPHQAHGEQVLAQAVVDGVEERVARAATGPAGSTPSSTMARLRTCPDAWQSRVRSRSMKTALVATVQSLKQLGRRAGSEKAQPTGGVN